MSFSCILPSSLLRKSQELSDRAIAYMHFFIALRQRFSIFSLAGCWRVPPSSMADTTLKPVHFRMARRDLMVPRLWPKRILNGKAVVHVLINIAFSLCAGEGAAREDSLLSGHRRYGRIRLSTARACYPSNRGLLLPAHRSG